MPGNETQNKDLDFKEHMRGVENDATTFHDDACSVTTILPEDILASTKDTSATYWLPRRTEE